MRELTPRSVNQIDNLGAFLRAWLGDGAGPDMPSPGSHRSVSGNINLAGTDWASQSELLPFRHAAFAESIEPGVRALALAFVKLGAITYTSCEGHHYADAEPDELHVGVLIRNGPEAERLERIWRNMEVIVQGHCELGVMRHAVQSQGQSIRAMDFYLLKSPGDTWQNYFNTRVALADVIADHIVGS